MYLKYKQCKCVFRSLFRLMGQENAKCFLIKSTLNAHINTGNAAYRFAVDWGQVYVCLFIWSLSSHSKIFHSCGDVTIAGEGLQILTYARHSWPLSSDRISSLMCHTYCDTGLLFIMVISEDPWHSHLLPNVWQLSCHYLFLRFRAVATGDRTEPRRMLFLYAIAAVNGTNNQKHQF